MPTLMRASSRPAAAFVSLPTRLPIASPIEPRRAYELAGTPAAASVVATITTAANRFKLITSLLLLDLPVRQRPVMQRFGDPFSQPSVSQACSPGEQLFMCLIIRTRGTGGPRRI